MNMKITSQMVKELRDKTNAGMMDCKKALQEHDGDMEKAVDFSGKKAWRLPPREPIVRPARA